MKKIVIIFGSPLRTTMGIIRSLHGQGYYIVVLLEPCERKFTTMQFSRLIDKLHFLDKLEDGLEIIQQYKSSDYKLPILFSSDSSILLLDRHYDQLKNDFHFFNAGEQGKVNTYLDKINTFPIAEESGLTLIKSWLVNDIHCLPKDITFPCLTKGNNSTASDKSDMHICQNMSELKSCLREGVEYLIQEYIMKEYELDFVGFAYNHGKDIYIPAVVRKIRDDLFRQSVYIRLDDIKDYTNFDTAIIRRLLKKIGYEGIFSIETIYSKGKYYFLEINLRNDGCQWIYTAAGINYPLLWIKYGEGKLDDKMLSEIKFKTPFYLMAQDDVYNMLEGKVSLLKWLRDWWKSDTSFSPGIKDPLPYAVGFYIHLRQLCKKVIRLFGINVK